MSPVLLKLVEHSNTKDAAPGLDDQRGERGSPGEQGNDDDERTCGNPDSNPRRRPSKAAVHRLTGSVGDLTGGRESIVAPGDTRRLGDSLIRGVLFWCTRDETLVEHQLVEWIGFACWNRIRGQFTLPGPCEPCEPCELRETCELRALRAPDDDTCDGA